MSNGIDGAAAAQTLLDFRTVSPGLCLYYVWKAYETHGATSDRAYPTALSAWNASAGQHGGDWEPPAGVPVWWGAKPSSDAGDVVISLGGGLVAATDYPRYGVVGTCTLAERTAQIDRPYLGWSEEFIGNKIAYGKPSPIGGMDMSTVEIISCPAWEQANQRVVTNGSACMTVNAGWTIEQIQNGVTFRNYPTNQGMLDEVSWAWQLGGLSLAAVELRLLELAKQVDGLTPDDVKAYVTTRAA